MGWADTPQIHIKWLPSANLKVPYESEFQRSVKDKSSLKANLTEPAPNGKLYVCFHLLFKDYYEKEQQEQKY